jgi:Pentapeptide repeats (8 copies)
MRAGELLQGWIGERGERMRMHFVKEKPETWAERRARVRRGWARPFLWLEHQMNWLAYFLSNWAFLEVLEYLGSFGVLIAVIFYFAESGDRLKQKHYQAWQVIDLAEGKGGNGGRIDALEELNEDGVSLVGVNLSSAFLVGVRLPKANLARATFEAADARRAQMRGADVEDASLRSANLRGAALERVSFERSVLDDADLSGADLQSADLTGASLENTDLRNTDLEGVKWTELRSVKGANIYGVKNAPAKFLDWARAHGAVEAKDNSEQ